MAAEGFTVLQLLCLQEAKDLESLCCSPMPNVISTKILCASSILKKKTDQQKCELVRQQNLSKATQHSVAHRKKVQCHQDNLSTVM